MRRVLAIDWTRPGKRVGAWERWEGGRARWDGTRWTFHIRKGTTGAGIVERSTGRHDHANAMAHLAAFQANPEAYHPEVVRTGKPPLFLTSELGREWLDWMEKDKGNGAEYLRNSKYYIQWWRDRLVGRDLRTLDVKELSRLSAKESAKAHKVRAIKCLHTWLRGEASGFRLAANEGADTSVLRLPQAKGHKLHHLDAEKAKDRREKGMRALLGYFRVREAKQFLGKDRLPYRDALDLLAATFWHTTELVRWLKLGSEIESMPKGHERIGAAKLWTIHKNGKEHRRAISKSVLVVAERLKAWHIQERLTTKGRKYDHVPPFPVRFLIKLVHDACAELGIKPKFGPGHLRHAGATFAGLVQLEQMAAGLPVTVATFTPADLALDGTIDADDIPEDLDPLERLRAAIKKRLLAQAAVPALPAHSPESVRDQVKAARAASKAQMGHAPGSKLLESTYMDASVQLDLPPEAEI